MGRIVSIIQFTGRAGSAVGSKGKGGKVLLRQYQPSVTNPRTPAQMSQRAKMKLAAQVAGMLGDVVDLNKVSSTNYDFSPVVSVALAVASNGATEASNGNSASGGSSNTGGSSNAGQSNTGGGSNTGSNTGAETGGNGGNASGDTTEEETLEAPVISGSTTFSESTQVTITGPDGAEIRYTTDGSTPTAESTLYSEPFTLTNNTRVKAIAIKNGVTSPEATKYFTHDTVSDGE